jgi:hypothetical protein
LDELALKAPEGALRVSVNEPWVLASPSPSSRARPVKTRDEAVPLVMARLVGSCVMRGEMAAPSLPEITH